MNGLTDEQLLLRNLKDAGCDDLTIERYLKRKKEGREREQMRLLSLHRASLLDRLHVNQRMIDCLDYLIYQMEHKQ